MVGFRESLVTDASAHALLAEYFSGREETTATSVTTFPDPARFVEPDGVFLVVETGDGDVGCGGIRRLSSDVFEIKHVYLQPRTRGQGLGRALLAELERRAVLLGATRVVLDTNESQVAAAQLYRSTGYVEIEPYNDNGNATNWFSKEIGPIDDDVVRFLEAAAAWRVGIPGSRDSLIVEASKLLGSGHTDASIISIASLYSDANALKIDELVGDAIDELGVTGVVAGNLHLLSARRMCRLVVTGVMDERVLTTWVHEQFSHVSEVELLDRLALLDDEWDGAVEGWGVQGVDELRPQVRAAAQEILDTKLI